MSKAAALFLMKQFKALTDDPVEGFSPGLRNGNPFEWDILIMGPPDTLYEGGMFKAELIFPQDFPDNPPVMRFLSEMYHPNIYKDGRVCISILHPPGDDQWGYEDASERWSPIQSVSSILLSVISMLSAPNCDSPANVDASVDCMKNPEKYKKIVRRLVRKSQDEFFM